MQYLTQTVHGLNTLSFNWLVGYVNIIQQVAGFVHTSLSLTLCLRQFVMVTKPQCSTTMKQLREYIYIYTVHQIGKNENMNFLLLDF